MLYIFINLVTMMTTTKFCSLVLAMMMISVSALANDPYSANYELELKVNDAESTVRTRASFDVGDKIVHDFGAHQVTMVIDEKSAVDYMLTVAVSSADSSEILKQKFAGTYGGILEFEAKNQLANVNGAIIVGSFK